MQIKSFYGKQNHGCIGTKYIMMIRKIKQEDKLTEGNKILHNNKHTGNTLPD